MKNGNKILLGILTFVVVCVIGYALFSDTISVNGSATASGNFEITTTCTPGYSDELIAALGNPEGVTNDTNQHGFENDSCIVNGNEITATSDLLYPGAVRLFTIKMTNTGSIPSIIWGADDGDTFDSFAITDGTYTVKNIQTGEIIKNGSGNSLTCNARSFNLFSFYIMILDSNGNFNSDGNVIYDRDKAYAGIKLNPGDSLVFLLNYNYDSGYNIGNTHYQGLDCLLSDNGKSEYIELKLKHEFLWNQYIDSPNYESTTFDEWCFNGC